MVVIIFLSILLSGYSPQKQTLAYATNVSQQGLLEATNQQRHNHGKNALILNEELDMAAQAKADDMTRRNYWSHNTPDGKEPWVFINKAGYSYVKAGENLAYGFLDSNSTVDGWMNSEHHRDNLLDNDFTEVGFGFANSNNYNNAGKETVVVAMYAKPYPNSSKLSGSTVPVNNSSTSTSSGNGQFVTANPRAISRLETLLNKQATWLVSAISFSTGILVTVLLVRHSVRLKHLIKDSKKFITHHPFIDSTILALIILGFVLTRTVGFII